MSNLIDPCLGPEGTITQEAMVGTKMFLRYYLAHKSSSVLYPGGVQSLNFDVARAGNDIDRLLQYIEHSLMTMFTDSFTIVEVSVTKEIKDNSSLVNIKIALSFGTETINAIKYLVIDPLGDRQLQEWLNKDFVPCIV